MSKKYREEHKDAIREKHSSTEYRERAKVWSRRSYRLNKDKWVKTKRAWVINNPDKVKVIQRRYRENNPDLVRQHNKKTAHFRVRYKKENPHKMAFYGATRRAALLKATPPWLTPDQRKEIESFYSSAKALTIFHETPFHVDHIEPLLGKNVRGLHVPWNLQVISAETNLQKGNKVQL